MGWNEEFQKREARKLKKAKKKPSSYSPTEKKAEYDDYLAEKFKDILQTKKEDELDDRLKKLSNKNYKKLKKYITKGHNNNV